MHQTQPFRTILISGLKTVYEENQERNLSCLASTWISVLPPLQGGNIDEKIQGKWVFKTVSLMEAATIFFFIQNTWTH